jgi:WD40 repeat protein
MNDIVENSIVRFFSSYDKSVVGAGFLVDNRLIVSCAHVVNTALNKNSSSAEKPQEFVQVDFPFVKQNFVLEAKVISWHPKQADMIQDISILQLQDRPPNGAIPAKLVSDQDYSNLYFKALGFPKGYEQPKWIEGTTKGKLPNHRIHVGDVKNFGFFLEQGFSGTPILCPELNGIIGIAATDDLPEERRSASIIPTDLLRRAYPNLEIPRKGTFWDVKLNAPTLKGYYTRRTEELQQLRARILTDRVKKNGEKLTVLHGFGGIGKSSLAYDFSSSEEVLSFFSDGVFWLKIGQEASDAELTDYIEIIGNTTLNFAKKGEEQKYLDINNASSQLKCILETKRCLIVLDDIWNQEHIRPFLNAIGERCRLLITTRKREIHENFGANDLRLNLLNIDKAMEIFNSCAERYEPGFLDIVEKLNGLTLAIVLVGKNLKKRSVEDWLEEFNKISSIKYGRNPRNADESLMISIELSLDNIFEENEASKKLYHFLGIFPDNAIIPKKTIVDLWRNEDKSLTVGDCYELIEALDDQELLIIDERRRTVTLYNLLRDYNSENLGNANLKVQNDLISIYNPDSIHWYDVQDDGYLYNNLAYHLKASGKKDELRELLFNIRWLEAKIRETDITAVIADFDISMEEDERRNRNSEINLVKSALQLSAHILVKQKRQLWEQLYGRLKFSQGHHKKIQKLLSTPVKKVWLRPLEECLFPPGTSLLQTLQGHQNTISSILVNDQFIVSASEDATIQVWDRSTDNNLKHIFSGHKYGVTSIAISTDGKYIVSGSYDCTWRKWEIERDGKLRDFKIFPSNQGSIFSIALDLNDAKVVSGGQDGTIKVWDFETGNILKTLPGHKGIITTVAISQDGNMIISGSYDKTIKLWNLRTGEVKTLAGHDAPILSVALHEGAYRQIISSSADQTLRVWDLDQVQTVQEAQPTKILNKGIYGWISSVHVSHGGDFILFGSYDNTLRLWDFQTDQPTRLFHGHGRQVTTVALSPNGSTAISGSHDRTMKIWDLNAKQQPPENLFGPRTMLSVKASKTNNSIFCGSNDGLLIVYDSETLEIKKELDKQNLIARSVDISADGKLGVVGLSDGSVQVWELESGKLQRRLMAHNGRVMTVALSSNKEVVASGSEDTTIRIWELRSGLELIPPLKNNAHVHSILLSSDLKTLYAGLRDSTIKAWDIESREELYTIRNHKGPVHTLALSPDEKTLFSGSADKTIIGWNSSNGEKLFDFPERHQNWIWSVSVSQDGKHLLSSSEDCTVRVWDIDSKQNIATFNLENTVFDCAGFIANDIVTVCCASISKLLFFKLENYVPSVYQ